LLVENSKKLWGGALWSPSYFAGNCGGAPISVNRKYIEQQQMPHSATGQSKEGRAFLTYIPALNGEVLRAKPINQHIERLLTNPP